MRKLMTKWQVFKIICSTKWIMDEGNRIERLVGWYYTRVTI